MDIAQNYNLLNKPDDALATFTTLVHDTINRPVAERTSYRAPVYRGLANTYFLKKDYKRAAQFGEIAYNIIITNPNYNNPTPRYNGLKETAVILQKQLYMSYKELGQTEKYLYYLERFNEIRDTLSKRENNENLRIRLNEVEKKYNYEKIQLEAEQEKAIQKINILRLSQENRAVKAENQAVNQEKSLAAIVQKNERERLIQQNKQTELRRKLESQRLQHINEQTRLLSNQRNQFLLALLGIFASISVGYGVYRHKAQQKVLRLKDVELKEKEAAFTLKLSQTEMAALRAQMNPHFIFNCLNSIQFFTAKNESDKASDYLTKFARLIRLVLENSKSERITLENELETLRLYIEMEAMRFPQKLHYQIQLPAEIEAEAIQIPPLLLQPFVENAIWHGLMHKHDGGTVWVTVEQPQEDLLRIEITDDGVGRAKAAAYKSKSATKRKSFGMKITADRIELINQLYQTQTQVQITDLTDGHGQAIGTRVVVEIPV